MFQTAEATRIESNEWVDVFDYGNGIYEIVFHQTTRQAVDAWLAAVAKVNEPYGPNDVVRFIVNPADAKGELPLAYALRKSQDFTNSRPNRPRSRTVVFYRASFGNSVLHLFSTFTSWLGTRSREKGEFFPIERRAEGIAWLMRD